MKRENKSTPTLLFRRSLVALLIPALFNPALPSYAADSITLPPGITQLHSIEGIVEYQLPNGLRVLLAHDASKPTTTVNMTYLVGSRHENYGETGMAHLLEHMMFKGTPNTPNALAEFSKRGLQANGTTWTDRTNYFASFAANDDTLDWYLGWQADAMVNSKIARADLDSEMTVVRNEMESGENNPFRVLMGKMLATAYQWHNYGKTTIGARSDVENVDTDRLRAFYKQYYQPDNAVLIVAGSFDPVRTMQTIENKLGSLPRPSRTLPRLYTIDPVQDGERSVMVRRVGGTPLVSAMYHAPAAAAAEFAALDLAALMLSDQPAGRLHKALIETGIATDTFGFTFDNHDPGIVMFGLELAADGNIEKAQSVMTQTLENLNQHPFTQEELDRARNKWLQSWELTYADPQKLGIALSESIAAGDWRLFFLTRDRVKNMQLQDVQQAAESYLLASNRTLGTYVPTEKPLRAPNPTTVDVQELLANYQGDPNFKAVAEFDTSAANIDASTQLKTIQLDNGSIRMALLPKEVRGDRVVALLKMQFSDVDKLRGYRDISGAVATLLSTGTHDLSRQEIQDRFNELKAKVGFSGAGTQVQVNISTTHDNLNAVISLVLHILKDANFPESQLEEYRRSVLTGLESARSEPEQVASLALSRHFNQWDSNDLRYTPTVDEDIASAKSLTQEQLIKFHNEFYGAGSISLSVVGAFDPAALESLVTQEIGAWKTAPAYTRTLSGLYTPKVTRLENNLADKANAFYISNMPLAIQDDHPDYVALTLGNFLLGMSENSRLWMRVRETEGLSYNIRSVVKASSFEPVGSWSIYAIYAPENREKLETAIQQEIAKVLDQGFTDQEIKDGIQAILNYRNLARAQDGQVASTWLGNLETGRNFAYTEQINQRLQSLTADEVNAVMKKYLRPELFSVSVAGSFKP